MNAEEDMYCTLNYQANTSFVLDFFSTTIECMYTTIVCSISLSLGVE